MVLFVSSNSTSFFVFPINKSAYIEESDGVIRILGHGSGEFFGTDVIHFFLDPRYVFSNDTFRHPLFSICFAFFMPLIQFVGLLWHAIFSSAHYSFAVSIATVQIALFIISGIMLKRIYSSKFTDSFAWCITIIYLCSFPIVFTFIPERLIFTSFFLITTIYSLSFNSTAICMFCSLGAIFSTCLSICPIIILNVLKRKIYLASCLIIALGVIILSRHFISESSYKGLPEALSLCSQDDIVSIDKFYCFNEFITSNFFVPNWKLVESLYQPVDQGVQSSYTKQYIFQNSSISHAITGTVIYLLCIFGFFCYRNDQMILVSFLWLLIATVIIGIVGFGITESVLYCSYFSWAIIPLALLPFYWLWQKFPRLPVPQALYLFAAYLAVSNLYFIYQIVQTVSERYIVPPGM